MVCYRNIVDIHRHMVEDHDILVGMTLDEAKARGYYVRAVKIDGVGQTVTCENASYRYNVEVADGKIVKFVGNG